MGPKMRAVVDAVKGGGIFSTEQLAELGAGDKRLRRRLVEGGYLQQVHRGAYSVTDDYRDPTVQDGHNPDLEEYAIGCLRAGPGSFICLYAAARYHGLTEDSYIPLISVGMPHSVSPPVDDGMTFKYHRFRQEAATAEGIEVIGHWNGIQVRMTSRERTVVDLFRYSPANDRSENSAILIDEESAEFAIRYYLRDAREYNGSPAKLSEMARQFGIAGSIAPYLKSAPESVMSRTEDESVPAPGCP
jgi:predicted transcriptional regulator of viral defense system